MFRVDKLGHKERQGESYVYMSLFPVCIWRTMYIMFRVDKLGHKERQCES